MPVPPVFSVDDLTPALLEDLRDASAVYCNNFDYTAAFDDLMVLPERRTLIEATVAGDSSPLRYVEAMRDWLLSKWASARSLTPERLPAIGEAIAEICPGIARVPPDVTIENADSRLFVEMADAFARLDACNGVAATIASKLLAPMRPALFPMWDWDIACTYGFALSGAGYRRFLGIAQVVAQRARELLNIAGLRESDLSPQDRPWKPPLAKLIDEWHWIRITKRRLWLENGTASCAP